MHQQLQTPIEHEEAIRKSLFLFPEIRLAIIFGSLAKHQATFNSDLDIGLLADKKITTDLKLRLINSLATIVGRPVDLIDLKTVGEPLLGEILQHGKVILGDTTLKANLLTRHLIDKADFLPYQNRILEERRNAWLHTPG